ncbi:sensor histidine kinase [Rhodopirellula sallentina]|uniref:Sensor histidine kinase n=1 Tax=Rhodopirellula sallentina SM41 TaxID=1263870 RepID=M5TW90_9BACT|nr:histidine kinase [Rhodopirellula sallentina]EMI53477.1 sensor histidine kinase [Rhodopirellula sallentina SM41]
MTARVLFRIVELCLIGWLLPLAGTTAVADQPPRQEDAPLRQLEARLAEIRSEEAQLAEMTFRSGVGNLGWESAIHPHADFTEWAKIEFDQEHVIDQIVLVPILWRDTQGGVRSDGFPLHFKIFVGGGGDDIGTEVVSFDERDEVLPRMEPLVLPIQPLTGSWIRVEATKLTPRALDGGFLFQLSEIMVFSGLENVALGCETTVSSTAFTRVRKSAPIETLIDGFTPYLMDAAGGRGSQAFVGFFRTGPQAALTIDLGQQRQINRIHLHAADLSENVPQIQHSDYAMPDQFVIEGANRSDFSDAVLLHEYEKKSIYDAGPIVMCRFARHSCRFVRITAVRAYKAPEASDNYRCIGFAEIAIFENSRNVARGIIPTANMEFSGKDGTLAALTDGRNHFGPIMPIRDWMAQLARRHELDSDLPRIQAALKSRYATQSRNLRWASILVAVLFAAIVFTVLVDRLIRIRETNRLKERFAADLHDEVGADLHTIGLLSDLARDVAMDRTKLDPILTEIRGVSEEASQSVRHISGIRNHSLYSGLVDLMKQSAERIGVQLEHEFSVEGNEFVEELRPRTRADLFLFYKECLVNVIRHSGATCLSTVLKASPSEVRLTIQDNGHGCDDAGDSGTPPSLKRRAKLLGAKVTVESRPQKGTRIDLQFKRRQWNQLKKR